MTERYILGDTIVALATAPVPAGVAVIRLSGPDAWDAAGALMPKFLNAEPRMAVFGALRHGDELLDRALVIGFKAPASFTGEDVVEIHTHGGAAVVDAVLAALRAQPGVRMALAGEYSRRAVLNGKMDMTAAEGLADLIAASTDAQRRQAVRQLDGELGRQFEDWRVQILALLAQVEAAIDFPDEELDVLAAPELSAGMRAVMDAFNASLGECAGERIREGVKLAIVGKPNAGKSTLLNVLAGREVAIVSAIAGTTRDVVSRVMDIGGIPVTVADTAGLRESDDVIEVEGVRRARREAQQADVKVAVVDGRSFRDIETLLEDVGMPDVMVVSHADVAERDFPPKWGEVPVVAVNLTETVAAKRVFPVLEQVVRKAVAVVGDAAVLTRVRHREAVEDALASVGRALVTAEKVNEGSVAELVAQDLRDAAYAVGRVTGRTGSEDVLDVVFSTFCIGK